MKQGRALKLKSNKRKGRRENRFLLDWVSSGPMGTFKYFISEVDVIKNNLIEKKEAGKNRKRRSLRNREKLKKKKKSEK